MVCDNVVCVKDGVCVCDKDEAEAEADGGIQNQKQEPHTKMWGKRNVINLFFNQPT